MKRLYLWIIFNIPQLTKYNAINILLTIPILKGSGVGVSIAPIITLRSIAYLHFLIKNSELIIPTFAKKNITVRIDQKHLRYDEYPQEYGSYQKAKTILGWSPKTTLQEGLQKTIDSF